MATYVSDTFTDTAATALASHTGETGATWAAVTGRAIAVVISDANRLRVNTAGQNNLFYASGTPAGAEVTVEVDFNIKTIVTGDFVGPAARMATGAETGYLAQYTATSTAWQLYRFSAGVFTQLGSNASMTLTPGQTYHVVLECLNATKTLYVDGVQILQSADNTVTASGKAGCRFVNTTAGTNTTSIHLDNFLAYDGVLAVPVNSVAPVASGTGTIGQTLSVTTGTWSNFPTSYAYQWKRDGSNIASATSSTYLLVSADGGTTVTCAVTATNQGGAGSAATSNGIAVAAAASGGGQTNRLLMGVG